MASSNVTPTNRASHEDVLAHLPISTTIEYPKGQIIYGQHQPSSSIYLIASGKVKLSLIAADGSEILLDILRTDELFGQEGFLTATRFSGQASALERCRLMIWPISAVEELVTKRPRLAVALLQIFAQRTVDLARRIESFSTDNVERRLARALLHFSERLGVAEGEGNIRMMPFTHQLLSRYVGTSREVVTQCMNQFRKQGYLRYSRQEIVINRAALAGFLRHEAHAESAAHAPYQDPALEV